MEASSEHLDGPEDFGTFSLRVKAADTRTGFEMCLLGAPLGAPLAAQVLTNSDMLINQESPTSTNPNRSPVD